MELMGCPDLAVPAGVMHHVVGVESSFNPYAIGVVGGRLARQPANLPEALATARMLESRGYNFSLGLAQVNRYNLAKYGIGSYEQAFQACPNLQAGSRILAECHQRSGQDWGKSFSCYYSGNFVTGFRQGYVQKIYASMRRTTGATLPGAIAVYGAPTRRAAPAIARPAGATRSAFISSRVETTAPSVMQPTVDANAPSPPPPMDGDDAAAQALVVLRPGGEAPRALSTAAPPAPQTPERPRDAAFVF